MAQAPTPFDRATPRTHEVNWGDKTRIVGKESKTLAWVSVAESRPMTVYATAVIRGAAPGAGVAFVANIEWGHGGASVAHDFPVVRRLRMPVAASMVKIAGRLLDRAGSPPAATVYGDISVLIAPGVDGDTLRNTTWISGTGARGAVSTRPERVMCVEGYNAGVADTWIMVFDGPGQSGDAPQMARPVRAGRAFRMRRDDSQAFRSQVTWAASSTPLALTPDPAASMRVDAELLL
jgi:hypothetical protein